MSARNVYVTITADTSAFDAAIERLRESTRRFSEHMAAYRAAKAAKSPNPGHRWVSRSWWVSS